MKTSMVKRQEMRADRDIVPAASGEKGWTANHRSILLVLERAAEDSEFIDKLTREGSLALAKYELSWEEKAALVSGDVRWIESRVGTLTERQKTWLNCRLQQERW